MRDLGNLLYQSPLLVSEQSRFGIKAAEKERHVFAFDRALLFARKVELGQGAKFKYEHKFTIPVSRHAMYQGWSDHMVRCLPTVRRWLCLLLD